MPISYAGPAMSAMLHDRGRAIHLLAGKWKFNETSEQLVLAFPAVITASQLSVLLRFNYTLNEGLSGFYRSSYKGSTLTLSC